MTTRTITAKSNLPWCETSPPLPSLVAFYWATHCLWILNFLIAATGTYKMFMTKNATTRIFKILWISIAFLFSLSPPGFAFGYQSGWECWFGFFGWEAITMIGVDGYLYGLAVLNLFFIMRLKTVFAETTLKLKSVTLTILSICVFIQIITPLLSTYYFLSGWNAYVRTWALRYFAIFTYTNIISSTIVLVLFVRKILLLPTMNSSTNAPNRKYSNEASQKTKFLNAIMKYMVCAVFSSLSTFIVASFGIWRSEAEHSDIFYRGTHIFSMVVDCSVNLICLYLQFPFGFRLYKKLCGATHSGFQRCFMKVFHLNVSIQYVSENANNVSSDAIDVTKKTNNPSTKMTTAVNKSVQVSETII